MAGQRGSRQALRLFAALHRSIYRLTGGRVGGRMMGAPVLLLTTRGRRTGARRTTPLLYLEDGRGLVVIASNGGASADPAWSLNLEANPDVEVQLRQEHRRLRARRATAAERERLWPRAVALYGHYEDYARKTDREIPVVLLEPPP